MMKLVTVGLCATLAISTLSACAEGDGGGSSGSGGDTSGCVDLDDDGKFAIRPNCPSGTDCADNDPNIPGPQEIPGNGKDDDCKGGDATVPSDCTRAVDKDGDGYYDDALLNTANAPKNCKGPDCDDDDRNVLPQGPGRRGEVANNGKDDDCNPATPDVVANCKDVDKDGWGTQNNNQCPNRQPADYDKFDCNDDDDDIYPGNTEICDGKDNDCDDTGDGKGVDECLDAAGAVAENIACGVERKLCLGNLKAPCTGNRDCDVESGFLCHQSKCLIFGENAKVKCFENDECVTGTCDAINGKCQKYCEVTDCGTQNVCGEATDRLCDENKGCQDCIDSSNDGKCGCGLCAGFKCFDGQYFSPIADQSDEEGSLSPLRQVLETLIDCYANNGSNNTVLCTSYETSGLGAAVSEASIDDYVCGDHEGLEGDRYDSAKDLVGCGLFNLDELEMGTAISPGTFYTTCAWWDGADVKVGLCEDFPANR